MITDLGHGIHRWELRHPEWHPGEFGAKVGACIGRQPLVSPSVMSDHVYKTVEITGTSPEGIQPAVDRALAKAGETLRNIDWFEVSEIRGAIADGVTHYQVTVKIGFRLD